MKDQAKKEVAKEEVKVDQPVEIKEPERVSIVLDLAPASGGAIVHNGITYLNRVPYKVEQGVANDLKEIENRGWAHEKSLHENENKNRRNNRAFV